VIKRKDHKKSKKCYSKETKKKKDKIVEKRYNNLFSIMFDLILILLG